MVKVTDEPNERKDGWLCECVLHTQCAWICVRNHINFGYISCGPSVCVCFLCEPLLFAKITCNIQYLIEWSASSSPPFFLAVIIAVNIGKLNFHSNLHTQMGKLVCSFMQQKRNAKKQMTLSKSSIESFSLVLFCHFQQTYVAYTHMLTRIQPLIEK